MHSLAAYILVAGAGLFVAWFLTRAPELRSLRLAQFIFLPAAFVAALSVLHESSGQPSVGDIGTFMVFLAILGFIILLLAPNIAHFLGAGFSNFLDPMDWTSAEEEIALRPVIRLIDKDRCQDAFAELEELLKTHRPTYDALHLKAKLLNHFQRFDETITTLHRMIPLSSTTQQQLVVMELLASLDGHQKSPAKFPAPGARPLRITHELVLFKAGAKDRSTHHTIPAGNYQVEEMIEGGQVWFVLAGQPWGNAAACWESVRETGAPARPESGFLRGIARMQQSLVIAVKGKSFRQSKADARAWLHQANQHVRQGDWAAALPLLEKASADDPDDYEIAFRFAQTACQIGPRPVAAERLDKVLRQSRWTEDQERMLKQLKS